MSESAMDPADFGGDIDWSQFGPDDLDFGIPEAEVDGTTYQFPDPDQERAILAEEVRQHELDQARAEVRESFPDLSPALLGMLDAGSPEELHELAATVAARLGVQSADRHPGAKADPVAQMEGDSLARAKQYAKQSGDMGPLFRLKEAEAIARSGLTSANITDDQAETVRQALAWARRSGDSASVAYLSRQLGGR